MFGCNFIVAVLEKCRRRIAARELVSIGSGLQGFLEQLSLELGLPFSKAEVDRVFKDDENDQVSQKDYSFCESDNCTVLGKVDEYEPGEIWIILHGKPRHIRSFMRLIEKRR